MDVCLATLARRHFEPDFRGTKITSHDPTSFIEGLSGILRGEHTELAFLQGGGFPPGQVQPTLHVHMNRGPAFSVADGYADFCKHLFVRNFTDAALGVAEIVGANLHLLRSGYAARRPGERAVLTRWFEREELLALGWRDTCPWLDLILYSKGQMAKEGQPVDHDWAIVSINSALSPVEAPMPPITMMRNALGITEGGSGVPLSDEAYEAAVTYWSKHATIR
jgi:hypothetical protein